MLHRPSALLVAALTLVAAASCSETGTQPTSARYEDLVTLFNDWRAFQKPKVLQGAPDYSLDAMEAQQRDLPTYQQRLAAIDPKSWPIAQQADYHIVRAEMNGLDFDQRVLRPWANNPAFYVTVFGDESDQPAREGHQAFGSVELWSYRWPLDEASRAAIGNGVKAVPKLLIRAKKNLVGTGHDLWTYAVGSLRGQSADLSALSAKLTGPADAALRSDVENAKTATNEFAAWVESEAPHRTGPSGIGKENYNWYLRNVMLLPYTWDDVVLLMQRELGRAHASLVMEEAHNAGLPPQPAIESAAEYDKRFQQAVTEYMAFLKDHHVMSVRDYMDGALRAQAGKFTASPREFFTEIDHHDPEVMRTHGYHWFDKARMVQDPHPDPIRRGALLYNIFITRTEGHATGWEELMLEAGMFDTRPRSRELIYMLIAQRAARALGDLRMHGDQISIEDAAKFTSANTPRGWLSLSGNLVRGEQHLYLQQPAYGTSYLLGKIQIERLIADRKRQLGDTFALQGFMDEFDAVGLIPISLVRWQLTGELSDDLKALFEVH